MAELTGPQESAVSLPGPIAVVAGPGSGKTRVAVRRILRLSEAGPVLALTFSVAAAREMEERIAALQPDALGNVRVMTIHSLAYQILAVLCENPIRPEITPAALEESLARQLCSSAGSGTPSWKNLLLMAGVARNRASIPEEYRPLIDEHLRECRNHGVFTFDDLIEQAIERIQCERQCRENLAALAEYMVVDEFQDLTPLQYNLVKLTSFCRKGCPDLADNPKDLCVIGDPAQSIYGFRGAHRDIFLAFEQDFPKSLRILLDSCFRCPPEVLRSAQAILGQDRKHYADGSFCSRLPLAGPVTLFRASTLEREGAFMMTVIEEATGGTSLHSRDCSSDSLEISHQSLDGGSTLDQIAIMTRTRSGLEEVQTALDSAGIPWTSPWSKPLLPQVFKPGNRRDTRGHDLCMTLCLSACAAAFSARNQGDGALKLLLPFSLDWKKLLTLFPGVGQGLAEKIARDTPETDPMTVIKTIDNLCTSSDLTQASREALSNFLCLLGEMDHLTARANCHTGLEKIRRLLLDRTILNPETETDPSREFIMALALSQAIQSSGIEAIGTLPCYLQATAGEQEALFDKSGVRLITAHSSKGLEFDHVIILGLEDGLFPWKEKSSSGWNSDDPVSEDRLMFVAMTRARKTLHLVSCAQRRAARGLTSESPFLNRLPQDLTRIQQDLDQESLMEKQRRRREWAKKERARKSQLSLF